MAFQNLNIRFIIICKFAISAITYTGTFAVIPNVAISWVACTAGTFRIVITAATAIAGRPGFFNKVSCISGHTPVMPVSTNLGVNIKIIQKNKLIGDGMVVWRNVFAKNAK